MNDIVVIVNGTSYTITFEETEYDKIEWAVWLSSEVRQTSIDYADADDLDEAIEVAFVSIASQVTFEDTEDSDQ